MTKFAEMQSISITFHQAAVFSADEAIVFSAVVNAVWRDPYLADKVANKSRGWKRELADTLSLSVSDISSALPPSRYSDLLSLVRDNPAGDAPSVTSHDILASRSTHGSCLHGTGTCGSCLHQTGTCNTCAACISVDAQYVL
jgi:hypothetical protein